MKTQFSFRKRGFTIVELMVAIAIMASLFAMMSQVTFRSQEDTVKTERIANKIQSILHSATVGVMMGKMGENGIASTGALITITSTGAGQGVKWSLTPYLTGSFTPPFFDNDMRYEIRSIRGCTSTNSGITTEVTIDISRNITTFSGTNAAFPADATILEIRAGYNTNMRRIVFDRRTGRIEIRKDNYTACQ